jgi:hypothetical protein
MRSDLQREDFVLQFFSKKITEIHEKMRGPFGHFPLLLVLQIAAGLFVCEALW